ncbi:MAG TPA: YbdD/YjiX family protein [Rhodoblastus sp.]|nr:YbdD/YjiX family protein [Rhodoblastus sp.]
MICLDCSPSRLKGIGRKLRQTASLMVGQPDYETYLAHWRGAHPDVAPMTRTEFFRNREDRRYGGGVSTGGFRCC